MCFAIKLCWVLSLQFWRDVSTLFQWQAQSGMGRKKLRWCFLTFALVFAFYLLQDLHHTDWQIKKRGCFEHKKTAVEYCRIWLLWKEFLISNMYWPLMKFLETWKCKGILQRSGKWHKAREWSGNLCNQGYLRGMAHTDTLMEGGL